MVCFTFTLCWQLCTDHDSRNTSGESFPRRRQNSETSIDREPVGCPSSRPSNISIEEHLSHTVRENRRRLLSNSFREPQLVAHKKTAFRVEDLMKPLKQPIWATSRLRGPLQALLAASSWMSDRRINSEASTTPRNTSGAASAAKPPQDRDLDFSPCETGSQEAVDWFAESRHFCGVTTTSSKALSSWSRVAGQTSRSISGRNASRS